VIPLTHQRLKQRYGWSCSFIFQSTRIESNFHCIQIRKMKRLALIAAGWSLLTLGSAGLFLPVLPGIPFLLVGLTILSMEYEWARRWVAELRRRFPAADCKLQSILTRF
jgi:hypothetical protein